MTETTERVAPAEPARSILPADMLVGEPARPLDVEAVRADFPILGRDINGKPLVYLDSAATSQKPRHVLDVVRTHYETRNANVSRSVHTLGTEATAAYEGARAKVAAFVGAT